MGPRDTTSTVAARLAAATTAKETRLAAARDNAGAITQFCDEHTAELTTQAQRDQAAALKQLAADLITHCEAYLQDKTLEAKDTELKAAHEAFKTILKAAQTASVAAAPAASQRKIVLRSTGATADATADPHTLIQAGEKIDYSELKANGIGIAERHGGRPTQEDRVLALTTPGNSKTLNNEDWAATLKATTSALEAKIELDLGRTAKAQGSCYLTTVVTGNTLHTANLGDSSAFVVTLDKDGKATVTPINSWHKPTDEVERAFIEANSGAVLFGRLNGTLAVSRAIGDTQNRESINHEPDIYHTPINIPEGGRAFVITACDGLTDTVTTDDIKKLVEDNLDRQPHELAALLASTAENNRSRDNISVIITPVTPDDPSPKVACVFDGHGGSAVSEALYQDFTPALEAQITARLAEKQAASLGAGAAPAASTPTRTFALDFDGTLTGLGGQATWQRPESPASNPDCTKEAVKTFLATNADAKVSDQAIQFLRDRIQAGDQVIINSRGYEQYIRLALEECGLDKKDADKITILDRRYGCVNDEDNLAKDVKFERYDAKYAPDEQCYVYDDNKEDMWDMAAHFAAPRENISFQETGTFDWTTINNKFITGDALKTQLPEEEQRFFKLLDRKQATDYLEDEANGSLVIRPSSEPGMVAITVKIDEDNLRHYQCQKTVDDKWEISYTENGAGHVRAYDSFKNLMDNIAPNRHPAEVTATATATSTAAPASSSAAPATSPSKLTTQQQEAKTALQALDQALKQWEATLPGSNPAFFHPGTERFLEDIRTIERGRATKLGSHFTDKRSSAGAQETVDTLYAHLVKAEMTNTAEATAALNAIEQNWSVKIPQNIAEVAERVVQRAQQRMDRLLLNSATSDADVDAEAKKNHTALQRLRQLPSPSALPEPSRIDDIAARAKAQLQTNAALRARIAAAEARATAAETEARRAIAAAEARATAAEARASAAAASATDPNSAAAIAAARADADAARADAARARTEADAAKADAAREKADAQAAATQARAAEAEARAATARASDPSNPAIAAAIAAAERAKAAAERAKAEAEKAKAEAMAAKAKAEAAAAAAATTALTNLSIKVATTPIKPGYDANATLSDHSPVVIDGTVATWNIMGKKGYANQNPGQPLNTNNGFGKAESRDEYTARIARLDQAVIDLTTKASIVHLQEVDPTKTFNNLPAGWVAITHEYQPLLVGAPTLKLVTLYDGNKLTADKIDPAPIVTDQKDRFVAVTFKQKAGVDISTLPKEFVSVNIHQKYHPSSSDPSKVDESKMQSALTQLSDHFKDTPLLIAGDLNVDAKSAAFQALPKDTSSLLVHGEGTNIKAIAGGAPQAESLDAVIFNGKCSTLALKNQLSLAGGALPPPALPPKPRRAGGPPPLPPKPGRAGAVTPPIAPTAEEPLLKLLLAIRPLQSDVRHKGDAERLEKHLNAFIEALNQAGASGQTPPIKLANGKDAQDLFNRISELTSRCTTTDNSAVKKAIANNITGAVTCMTTNFGVTPGPMISHYALRSPIAKELVKPDHRVSPNKTKKSTLQVHSNIYSKERSYESLLISYQKKLADRPYEASEILFNCLLMREQLETYLVQIQGDKPGQHSAKEKYEGNTIKVLDHVNAMIDKCQELRHTKIRAVTSTHFDNLETIKISDLQARYDRAGLTDGGGVDLNDTMKKTTLPSDKDECIYADIVIDGRRQALFKASDSIVFAVTVTQQSGRPDMSFHYNKDDIDKWGSWKPWKNQAQENYVKSAKATIDLLTQQPGYNPPIRIKPGTAKELTKAIMCYCASQGIAYRNATKHTYTPTVNDVREFVATLAKVEHSAQPDLKENKGVSKDHNLTVTEVKAVKAQEDQVLGKNRPK